VKQNHLFCKRTITGLDFIEVDTTSQVSPLIALAVPVDSVLPGSLLSIPKGYRSFVYSINDFFKIGR